MGESMNRYASQVYICQKCRRRAILLDTPTPGTHRNLRCPYCAVKQKATLSKIDLPPVVIRRQLTIDERSMADTLLLKAKNLISDIRVELF
jgi:DNA-directed RNA polymerase subunit RPC12/RpoP